MGPWSPHLWNGSWLPSILCRSTHPDLWEDCVWEGKHKWLDTSGWCPFPPLTGRKNKIASFLLGTIPLPLQFRLEGSVEKSASGGSNKTLRQPEERSQWHQGPQMVRHNRLDRHLREKGKTSPHEAVTPNTVTYTFNQILTCFNNFFLFASCKIPSCDTHQHYYYSSVHYSVSISSLSRSRTITSTCLVFLVECFCELWANMPLCRMTIKMEFFD